MGIFQKWQLPQCAIFQVCPSRSLWPLAHPIRSARAPHCSLQRHRGPNLTFFKVAACEIAYLGSGHLENCHMGSRSWENHLIITIIIFVFIILAGS